VSNTFQTELPKQKVTSLKTGWALSCKVAKTCPSKFDFMFNQTDLEFNQWTYRKTNATAKWEGSLPVNLRPEQPAKREGQYM